MKNRQINKVLLMFFLSFILFFSVSNAYVKDVSLVLKDGSVNVDYDSTIGESSVRDITPDLYNKYLNPDDPQIDIIFNERVQLIFNELGFNSYVMYGYIDTNGVDRFSALFFNDNSINLGVYDNDGKRTFCFEASNSQLYSFLKNNSGFPINANVYTYSTNNKYIARFSSIDLCYFMVSPNTKVHNLIYESDSNIYWDGTYYSEKPDVPTMTDSEFSAMLEEITTSELFYQHIPSDYRSNFYVQYDVNSDNYLFYFYPSNYQVNGLRRNENDYHIVCDKDFSWWDNVVDFLKKIFTRESENLDYKMIYVSVLEDGTYSCWYRSKSMLSVDETLFNFDLNPIVYSSVQIPFYGQHGGGGINIDTGDVTLATEPEYVINDEVYGESNIVYNPNPIETVLNEQGFWDKVVNRLSSLVSYVKDFPIRLVETIQDATGISQIITVLNPISGAFWAIFDVLISAVTLISRAVVFVYTLPTIEASRALFDVDVASTEGLSFVGNSWGNKFLEGFDMIKGFSWNGLNLWNLFSAFVVLMVAIQAVKYVRKHYHY